MNRRSSVSSIGAIARRTVWGILGWVWVAGLPGRPTDSKESENAGMLFWHRLIVMVILVALLCLALPAFAVVRAQGGLIVTRTGPLSAAGADLAAHGTGTVMQATTSETSQAESSRFPSWLIIFPVGLLILVTVSGAALAQAVIVQARRRDE
jgi:hypothetical protein